MSLIATSEGEEQEKVLNAEKKFRGKNYWKNWEKIGEEIGRELGKEVGRELTWEETKKNYGGFN
ncbi:MAG: hypothetical protein R3E08_04840 [Thiotrichaceae bacterium]